MKRSFFRIASFQYSFCAVISAARNCGTCLLSQTSKFPLVDSGTSHIVGPPVPVFRRSCSGKSPINFALSPMDSF